MCGITFCLRGISLSQVVSEFDLFQLYRENPSNSFKISQQTQEFLTYVKEQKLFISDFTPKDIFETIYSRGPDAFNCMRVKIPLDQNGKFEFQQIDSSDELFEKQIFSSSAGDKNFIEAIAACAVLHLRDDYNQPNMQPVFDETTGNVLLFNGEIFDMEQQSEEQFFKQCENEQIKALVENFDPYKNDTLQLFKILNCFSEEYSTKKSSQTYEEHIKWILDCFNGDFAFVFLDMKNKKILFSKDIFGKRSLLLGFHPNGFCLTSCSIKPNVSQKDLQDDVAEDDDEPKADNIKEYDPNKNHSGLVKENSKQDFLEKKYNNEYLTSLGKNWIEIPASKIYTLSLSSDSIEWKYRSLSGWQYAKISEEESKLSEDDRLKAQKEVCELLIKSVKNQIKNIFAFKPHFGEGLKLPEDKFKIENGITNSELAITFSGGLDSALIALICSLILPEGSSIDLYNIVFSNDAPDRENGIRAYQEIQKQRDLIDSKNRLRPEVKLNLILIDKTLDETEKVEQKVLNLIYPKITHMDFNISCALHLATQGEGYLYQEKDQGKKLIKSGAKIILSGLGADEVFGGYSRYRVAFLRGGHTELQNEMNFDLHRLWVRNLGRDDRSITSNSKEVRFPFLNRELITKVGSLDPHLLTNFNMPRGSGDKILLRAIAKELGLEQVIVQYLLEGSLILLRNELYSLVLSLQNYPTQKHLEVIVEQKAQLLISQNDPFQDFLLNIFLFFF